MGVHDTDRILGVLGDAITKLRTDGYGSAEDRYAFLIDLTAEVANDLALLHGAVSAERDRETDSLAGFKPEGWFTGRGSVVVTQDTQKRAFLRVVKDEEISDEVLRGEHRDD